MLYYLFIRVIFDSNDTFMVKTSDNFSNPCRNYYNKYNVFIMKPVVCTSYWQFLFDRNKFSYPEMIRYLFGSLVFFFFFCSKFWFIIVLMNLYSCNSILICLIYNNGFNWMELNRKLVNIVHLLISLFKDSIVFADDMKLLIV